MKKRLCYLLAAVFLISSLFSPVLAASTDELEAQKQQAAQNIEATKGKKNAAEQKIADIEAEVLVAEEQITVTKQKLAEGEEKLNEYKAQLAKIEKELAKWEATLAELEVKMGERLKAMYMFGNESYVQMIFSSSDLSDLMAKVDFVKAVIKADNETAKDYERAVAEVKASQAKIEAKTAEQETVKKENEVILTEQKELQAERQALLEKNKTQIAEYTSEIQSQQATFDAADAELYRIAAEKEAEAQRILAEQQAAEQAQAQESASQGSSESTNESSSGSGSSATSSSGYMWPISTNYYPMYDDDWFGPRVSPFPGASSYHEGIDIVSPGGTPLYAHADGVVVLAGWNGGYGNCVMITDGNGNTSLYGHLSDYYVSEGQYVSQGQTVGAVGTTGTSSGNHLHFGFMVGGQFVDPLGYFSWY